MRTLVALALLLASVPAEASVIYTYTGNPFTSIVDAPIPAGAFDTSMRVTGFIELASPLPANMPLTDIGADIVNASLSDGRHTLTAASPILSSFFFFQTDALGNIDGWVFALQQDLATRNGATSTYIWTMNDTTGALGGFPIEDRSQFFTCDPTFLLGCRPLADVASVAVPGAWSATVTGPSVPEPSAFALLAIAFAAWRMAHAPSARPR